MEKRYGLKIGDDVIYFASVLFKNETLDPMDEGQERLLALLSNTDTIINISEMDRYPHKGATWDGLSFPDTHSTLLDETSLDSRGKKYFDFYRFALLENNIVLGVYTYDKTEEKSAMMVAALSSDPQIIEME
jgi:hypothetical protein